MIYLILVNLFIFCVIYFSIRVYAMKLKLFEISLKKKENELNEHIDGYNLLSENFNNYYKNRVYQAALSFVQLKKYQSELIEILDSDIDNEMINFLKVNNQEIENILKEMSFISKKSLIINDNKSASILENIYLDSFKIWKN